ncbi:diguanylate cyclase (GGDEF)-like protein [Aeromonas sp. BIGb0405]|uniref:putative bifunctional diguanylate cyclase/phosphodiesterase n=1 Tax=Aeromonas sp. BIGb0405 TaxID=2940592 RepID=UPI0021673DF1|nr:bifunctional diguanylate cyclase/phosphodiesterase [Aeromonas sp. BIGb0405]MCS3457526.1 diguanylate cyclase (GGDEF)-like protein [Aeromonas sp. BIGb0405]
MSANPLDQDAHPLLALVSTILAFPPPEQASRADYHQLFDDLEQLCPLHQIGLLGLGTQGPVWLFERNLDPMFKGQLGREEPALSEHLMALDAKLGWCVLPISEGQARWLLVQGDPQDQASLRLLLECLAKRLAEANTHARLAEPASPLIGRDPAWQHKIEQINRILRLANSLPTQALLTQLDAALQRILGTHQLRLVRLGRSEISHLYPSQDPGDDDVIRQLCHETNPTERELGGQHWCSTPLRLQQHYFAHLLLATSAPLGTDDRLFLDFLRNQLTLLLELGQIRQQLNEFNSPDRLNHRLQLLRQANLRLQKQLRQHQELERKLQFDALHDPLTGLPNRSLLMNHLHHAMSHYQRHGGVGFTVIFLDIDHFKQINDELGHNNGDLLLRELGRRLQSCLRQNDLLARLGGDEFVIYLDNSMGEEGTSPVLNRIISRLDYPFRLAGKEVTVTVSMGVASVSEQSQDVSELLHQADLAMYQAKRNGRARVVHYTVECMEQAWSSPEALLSNALAEGRIIPYFQPVIRLEDNCLVGLEVMARWITREGELKDAFDFIPLAEQCGLIEALDHKILRQSCQQLRHWLPQAGLRKFKLAVNLCGQHLASPAAIQALLAIIEEEGVCPSYLIFEFNERELSRQHADIITSLHELRAKGIQISLDDFGSGFSSLSALFHYPVDYVKVDDGLTHRMLHSPKDLALIRAMRDICRDLDLSLVVEGIESQAQLRQLIELACPFGQGRYISPPLPGNDITPLLGVATNLEAD